MNSADQSSGKTQGKGEIKEGQQITMLFFSLQLMAVETIPGSTREVYPRHTHSCSCHVCSFTRPDN